MAAPLTTHAQFLEEHGFGVAPNASTFPEYPDLDAQLQALRKLDPAAQEIAWIEYALGRAREARLAGDGPQERRELAIARLAIENSFKRRTPRSLWPKIAIVLAIIGLIALVLWLEKRRWKRRMNHRRPQRLPHDEDDWEGDDDEDDDSADEDD
jgi:hypothetical protein